MVKDFAINDFSKEKECTVRLEYSNGFVIERSRRKGRPDVVKTFQREEIDGNTKYVYLAENEKGELKNTQKAIEDKLGINFSTFCKSIVMGQVRILCMLKAQYNSEYRK